MSEATYAIPTLKDELDRKVMETLEWLVHGRQKGLISEDAYSAGIDSLFMAVSGLVDGEFIYLITEAQILCGDHKTVLKKHFHAANEDKILTFVWTPGEEKIVTYERIGGIAVGGKLSDYKDASEAMQIFEGMSAWMTKKGWIEL
jgi:hypothetical protein